MGDLDKLIVPKGFKKLPEVQKIAQSGHTYFVAVCIRSVALVMTSRGMELFSRKNRPNSQTRMEYCHVSAAYFVRICHKHNSLPLEPIQPSSPSTKELQGRGDCMGARSMDRRRLGSFKPPTI